MILFKSNWSEVQPSSLNPLSWQDWSWIWGTVNVPTPLLLPGLEIPPCHHLSPEECDELVSQPKRPVGAFSILLIFLWVRSPWTQQKQMLVLVLCNFRASSALKSDLTQSTARLHVCCLLVFIPYMFYLQEKYSVTFPAWCSGRSNLGSERQKAWKKYEKSTLHCCPTYTSKESVHAQIILMKFQYNKSASLRSQNPPIQLFR